MQRRREALQLSRKTVSDKSGLNQCFLEGVERATVRASAFQLRKLAAALDTNLNHLLRRAGEAARRDQDLLNILRAAVREDGR